MKPFCFVLMFILVVPAAQAHAQFAWDVSSGAWNVDTNWAPDTGFPNGVSEEASLDNGGTITSLGTNVDVAIFTLDGGTFIFGGGSNTFTLNEEGFFDSGSLEVTSGATFAVDTATNGSDTLLGITATIAGEGTIQLDTEILEISSGGILSPGDSFTDAAPAIGELSVEDGDVSLEGIFAVDIAADTSGAGTPAGPTDSDLLSVMGDVTLGGTLEISEFTGFLSGVDSSYLIISATNVSGSFDTIDPQFSASGTFSISTVGGDVFLNYTVPEPSTYALLSLAAVGGFWHARRRKKAGQQA